jgi:hypothetical protein
VISQLGSGPWSLGSRKKVTAALGGRLFINCNGGLYAAFSAAAGAWNGSS